MPGLVPSTSHFLRNVTGTLCPLRGNEDLKPWGNGWRQCYLPSSSSCGTVTARASEHLPAGPTLHAGDLLREPTAQWLTWDPARAGQAHDRLGTQCLDPLSPHWTGPPHPGGHHAATERVASALMHARPPSRGDSLGLSSVLVVARDGVGRGLAAHPAPDSL